MSVSRAQISPIDYVFATTGLTAQTHECYGLFVVADGMGGHANGQLASRLGVHTLIELLLPVMHQDMPPHAAWEMLLTDAVHQANTIIYQQQDFAVTAPPSALMGTTLTAALVVGAHVWVANVGDSRTYLFRPGRGLCLLTRDHSVVADLVAHGELAPDDVYTHPERHKISRSLGAEASVTVDVFCEELADGDLLLLCSDGLWEMTRDQPLAAVLASSCPVEQLAEQLVQLALQHGGRDNIGLVVARWHHDVAMMPTMTLLPVCATRDATTGVICTVPAEVVVR